MSSDRLGRYSLAGPENRAAVDAGLANGAWYRSPIPRKRMKELMRRSDMPAVRDTAIWVGLMVVCASAGIALWGSWWAVPFFLVYGVLYGSASDSRWHEAGHGTAFVSRRLDEAVYQVACFMIMRDPTASRWSHTRHHTDTLVLGRDPEIQAMRPARLVRLLGNFFGLFDVPVAFKALALHVGGRLTADEADYVPETERPKVYRTARIWLAIYVGAVAAAVAFGSWLPLVLIGGPRVYGTFMHIVYGLTQHAGMGEDVLDHRLNTRTVKMNRINRFLYWNMNYHVEHHMFPMVPYHALPALHEELKADLPAPTTSIPAAFAEFLPVMRRQLQDTSVFIDRRAEGALPTPAVAPSA